MPVISVSKTTSNYSVGASLFYTWFKNALVVDIFKWNNASTIIYQGVKSDVFATQNKAKAIVYGFNVNGRLRIMDNTDITGTYTYTKGTYNNGVKEMPLDHIPPSYGRLGLKHDLNKFSAEIFTVFNGWKRIEDYNLNGEDNEIYATKDGMPAWQIWNINTSYQPTKKINFSFQIENIADLNYRYFASGISAVGRNYILSCRVSF